MKKILSLTLVVLMLLCIVPMNIFAGDTIVPDLPGFHTRYAEFHIIQNGGYYNANSGEAITNGSFYTAANGLNIPNGYTGNIVIYVYQGTNQPADAVMNHYVGVVYTDQGTVSNGFYPLGDLMTVIYRSMVKDGYTLTDLTWMNHGASWYDPAFLTVAIPAAVFADVGAIHGFSANWACVDHVFGTDDICDVCGEKMQLTYEVGDYTYKVVGSPDVPQNMHGLGVTYGWLVYATDKTQSSYGEIRETLHGFPVTFMYKTFDGCSNMTVAPAIPAQVQVAYNAYKGTAITTAPEIPNGLVKLYGTFKNCTNLTSVGAIPATVTDMTGAFSGCTSLTSAVTVNTVNNENAFKNTAITSVTLNVNEIKKSCFSGCKLKTITYNGTLDQWFNNLTVGKYNAAVKTANLNVTDNTASVVVKNGVTYVSGLNGAKDFFIANGTQNTYREVANKKVLGVTSAKFVGANVFAYGAALSAGNYTLCVRAADGAPTLVHFTVK